MTTTTSVTSIQKKKFQAFAINLMNFFLPVFYDFGSWSLSENNRTSYVDIRIKGEEGEYKFYIQADSFHSLTTRFN
jgi:hypothetical protein